MKLPNINKKLLSIAGVALVSISAFGVTCWKNTWYPCGPNTLSQWSWKYLQTLTCTDPSGSSWEDVAFGSNGSYGSVPYDQVCSWLCTATTWTGATVTLISSAPKLGSHQDMTVCPTPGGGT